MNCTFQLDRCTPIYYKGEHISGKVIINVAKFEIIEAIDLIFCGQAELQWLEFNKCPSIVHNDSTSRDLDEWQTAFSAQQQQIFYSQKLCTNIELRGHQAHKYNINIPLPKNLPATSKQRYGSIEYKLKVLLSFSKKPNKLYEQYVCIKQQLDLRKLNHLITPFIIYEYKDDHKVWFKIPCTGFTPGQRIPYHVMLFSNNKSQLIIKLNKLIIYKSSKPFSNIKIEKKCLMLKLSESTECLSFIQVPLTTEISFFGQHLLISLTYELEILLINSMKEIVMTHKIPLIIGTTSCLVRNEEFSDTSESGFINYGSSIEKNLTYESSL